MNNARIAVVAWSLMVVLVFLTETALTEETEGARGAELLAPLKRDLKQALVAGMQKGPLDAISVCKDQAPAIADSLSTEGVRIGRTSHRLRNPANSAPDWVDRILKTYLEEDDDRVPKLVSLADDRLGYVEPITLQPLCIACHGNNLALDVTVLIEDAYPEDQATGFEVGDLRGVYWVEYPATE